MSNPPPPPGAPPPPGGAPPPAPPSPPGTPPPPPGAPPAYGPAAYPTPPPAPPGPAGPVPGAPQPPPGYVAYGTPLQMRSALEGTGGLRIATLILMWVATAGSGLQLLAVINRRSVWNDPSSSFGDLVDADDTVAGAFLLYGVAALATAIVLSIWTLRAVRNSEKLGTPRLRPGLACGGWYIPFGNVFVPFIQIRRATNGMGASTVPATLWQVGWGAMVIGGSIVNTAINDTNAFDTASVSQDLSVQVTGAAVTFVAAIIAAAGATFAMRGLDAAVAARAEA